MRDILPTAHYTLHTTHCTLHTAQAIEDEKARARTSLTEATDAAKRVASPRGGPTGGVSGSEHLSPSRLDLSLPSATQQQLLELSQQLEGLRTKSQQTDGLGDQLRSAVAQSEQKLGELERQLQRQAIM